MLVSINIDGQDGCVILYFICLGHPEDIGDNMFKDLPGAVIG